MKPPDFVETALAIQCIEITRVARCELACRQITAAQVCVAKRLGTLAREKMEVQPASVSLRDALGFSEKSDREKENKIRIDLRLELESARRIFRCDLADSPFDRKR